MNRDVGRWALLLGCLLFAVLGQLYFSKRPAYLLDGVLFYAIAATCLLLVTRPAAARAGFAPQPGRTREDWVRLGLAGAGVLLGLMAVLQLRTQQENYWPVFWTWLAGMLLCLFSALPAPATGRAGFRAALADVNPWEVLVVLGLFALALVLRAWRIDSIPWTLSGDEGNFGRWAREVLTGAWTNMFSTGHLSMPSLYAFFQAAWLKLAGDNIFGLRLPWAIVGALSVLGAYLLVRRLFDRNLALLVTLLLTGYSYHIHYSRLGLNNIADPFFVVWTLYFAVLGWQGGRRWAWMVAGLLAGLALYFYTGGRQVPLILGGVLIWAALVEPRFFSRTRSGLMALVLGFAVSAGPMVLYAFQHPDDFNARINAVGIIQSGWLEREAQIVGRSQAAILGDQFVKVFFAFNVFPDRSDFYHPSGPLLDFPASVFFLLGVFLSVSRLVDWQAGRPQDAHGVAEAGPHAESEPDNPVEQPSWRYGVFVVWFFVAIIAGGVLTDNAPSSQRIVSASIPAIFFVAIALRAIVRAIASLVALPRLAWNAIALVVAVVLTFGSARYYFGPYQESMVYGSFNGEVSTGIGYYMQRLGPDWKQYFLGAPRMSAQFGAATFISSNPFLDVLEPLDGPPTFVDGAYNAAFIILPERIADLEFIQQAYPDGDLEAIYRDGKPEAPLLFSAYTVKTKSQG